MKRKISLIMVVIIIIALLPKVNASALNETKTSKETIKKDEDSTAEKSTEIKGSEIKISVLNYHEPEQLAKGVTISIGNKAYNSNEKGEVLVSVADMAENKPFIVSYKDDEKGEYLLYKTSTNIYKEDTVISINKDEVVNKKVKQLSDTSELHLRYAGVKIKGIDMEFPERYMRFNSEGYGVLTTNISNLSFFTDPHSKNFFFLREVKSNKLNEDVVIDNVKVGRLTTNPGVSGYMTVTNQDGIVITGADVGNPRFYAEGIYKYEFRYFSSVKPQVGTFEIKSNEDTLFKHDRNFKSNLSIVGKQTLDNYYDKITIKGGQTDGYGNQTHLSSDKILKYYIDGKEVKSENLYSQYSKGEFTLEIQPNIKYPKYTIRLEQRIDGTVVISDPCEITVNNQYYKELTVKSPDGGIIKDGTINISDSINSNGVEYIVSNGVVSIPKDTGDFTVNFLRGTTDKGEGLYVKDFKVVKDSSSIIYKDLTLYNVMINRESFGKELYNTIIRINGSGIEYNYVPDATSNNLKIWVKPNRHEMSLTTGVQLETERVTKITSTKLSENSNVELKDDCTTKIDIQYYNDVSAKLEFSSENLTDSGYNIEVAKDEDVYVKPGAFKLNSVAYNINNTFIKFGVEKILNEETLNLTISNDITVKGNVPNLLLEGEYSLEPSIYDAEGRRAILSHYNTKTTFENINTGEKIVLPYETVKPGIYNVVQVLQSGEEEIKRVETKNVTVVGSTEGYLKLTDRIDFGTFKLFEGEKEIYSNEIYDITSDSYYDLENKLDKNKRYRISKFAKTTEGIKNSIGTVRYNATSKNWEEVTVASKCNNITLDTSNLLDYSITDSNGVVINNKDFFYDNGKLELISGQTYIISGTLEDKDGYYYVTKKIIATDLVTNIKLEKVLGDKVVFENKSKDITNVTDITLKNKSGVELQINNLSCSKPVYVPRDQYTIDFKAPIGVLGFASYTKEIDSSKSNGNIIVGDKITYEASLSMDEYKSFFINFKNIKVDGVSLKDVNNIKISDKTVIKLMHGNKVLLNLDYNKKELLKGKCSFSLEENYKGAGKVVVNGFVIDVQNNYTDLVAEDINLDRIIDISDIVAVATSINSKIGDVMWDYRVNLESRDEVIDIVDLAKVSAKYNMKY